MTLRSIVSSSRTRIQIYSSPNLAKFYNSAITYRFNLRELSTVVAADFARKDVEEQIYERYERKRALICRYSTQFARLTLDRGLSSAHLIF
jgi:hypothetical protein